jgi:hypothetical protein
MPDVATPLDLGTARSRHSPRARGSSSLEKPRPRRSRAFPRARGSGSREDGRRREAGGLPGPLGCLLVLNRWLLGWV